MNDQDNKKDYTQVLLEDLRDQFKAFGEGLDTVSNQVERVGTDLQEFRVEMGQVLQEFRKEFSLIHKEIAELRAMLTTKADVARLEALEARVNNLERTLSQVK